MTSAAGGDSSPLCELFQACDLDGSGYIDKDELANICPDLTHDEIDNIFSELDGNGDGSISVTEFTEGFKGLSSSLLGMSRASAGGSSPGGTKDNNNTAVTRNNNAATAGSERMSETDEWQDESGDAGQITGTHKIVEELGDLGVSVNEDLITTLSCQEQVCELYQSLHHSEAPQLLGQFEDIILSVIKDIRSQQCENERLENSFKKEKDSHVRQIQELEEELEHQMTDIESKIRRQERDKLEQEKVDLKLSLENEILEMQNNMKKLQKLKSDQQAQDNPNTEMKSKMEEVNYENRFLQSNLTDAQTQLAMLRSELATIKQNYEEKCYELQSEKHTLEGYLKEQDNLSRQVYVLHDANKKLHDTNDDLRSALDTSRTSFRKNLESQTSPPISRGEYVKQYLNSPKCSTPAGNSSLADELGGVIEQPKRKLLPVQDSCEIDSLPEDFDSGHSTMVCGPDLDSEFDEPDSRYNGRRKRNRMLRGMSACDSTTESEEGDDIIKQRSTKRSSARVKLKPIVESEELGSKKHMTDRSKKAASYKLNEQLAKEEDDEEELETDQISEEDYETEIETPVVAKKTKNVNQQQKRSKSNKAKSPHRKHVEEDDFLEDEEDEISEDEETEEEIIVKKGKAVKNKPKDARKTKKGSKRVNRTSAVEDEELDEDQMSEAFDESEMDIPVTVKKSTKVNYSILKEAHKTKKGDKGVNNRSAVDDEDEEIDEDQMSEEDDEMESPIIAKKSIKVNQSKPRDARKTKKDSKVVNRRSAIEDEEIDEDQMSEEFDEMDSPATVKKSTKVKQSKPKDARKSKKESKGVNRRSTIVDDEDEEVDEDQMSEEFNERESPITIKKSTKVNQSKPKDSQKSKKTDKVKNRKQVVDEEEEEEEDGELDDEHISEQDSEIEAKAQTTLKSSKKVNQKKTKESTRKPNATNKTSCKANAADDEDLEEEEDDNAEMIKLGDERRSDSGRGDSLESLQTAISEMSSSVVAEEVLSPATEYQRSMITPAQQAQVHSSVPQSPGNLGVAEPHGRQANSPAAFAQETSGSGPVNALNAQYTTDNTKNIQPNTENLNTHQPNVAEQVSNNQINVGNQAIQPGMNQHQYGGQIPPHQAAVDHRLSEPGYNGPQAQLQQDVGPGYVGPPGGPQANEVHQDMSTLQSQTQHGPPQPLTYANVQMHSAPTAQSNMTPDNNQQSRLTNQPMENLPHQDTIQSSLGPNTHPDLGHSPVNPAYTQNQQQMPDVWTPGQNTGSTAFKPIQNQDPYQGSQMNNASRPDMVNQGFTLQHQTQQPGMTQPTTHGYDAQNPSHSQAQQSQGPPGAGPMNGQQAQYGAEQTQNRPNGPYPVEAHQQQQYAAPHSNSQGLANDPSNVQGLVNLSQPSYGHDQHMSGPNFRTDSSANGPNIPSRSNDQPRIGQNGPINDNHQPMSNLNGPNYVNNGAKGPKEKPGPNGPNYSNVQQNVETGHGMMDENQQKFHHNQVLNGPSDQRYGDNQDGPYPRNDQHHGSTGPNQPNNSHHGQGHSIGQQNDGIGKPMMDGNHQKYDHNQAINGPSDQRYGSSQDGPYPRNDQHHGSTGPNQPNNSHHGPGHSIGQQNDGIGKPMMDGNQQNYYHNQAINGPSDQSYGSSQDGLYPRNDQHHGSTGPNQPNNSHHGPGHSIGQQNDGIGHPMIDSNHQKYDHNQAINGPSDQRYGSSQDGSYPRNDQHHHGSIGPSAGHNQPNTGHQLQGHSTDQYMNGPTSDNAQPQRGPNDQRMLQHNEPTYGNDNAMRRGHVQHIPEHQSDGILPQNVPNYGTNTQVHSPDDPRYGRNQDQSIAQQKYSNVEPHHQSGIPENHPNMMGLQSESQQNRSSTPVQYSSHDGRRSPYLTQEQQQHGSLGNQQYQSHTGPNNPPQPQTGSSYPPPQHMAQGGQLNIHAPQPQYGRISPSNALYASQQPPHSPNHGVHPYDRRSPQNIGQNFAPQNIVHGQNFAHGEHRHSPHTLPQGFRTCSPHQNMQQTQQYEAPGSPNSLENELAGYGRPLERSFSRDTNRKPNDQREKTFTRENSTQKSRRELVREPSISDSVFSDVDLTDSETLARKNSGKERRSSTRSNESKLRTIRETLPDGLTDFDTELDLPDGDDDDDLSVCAASRCSNCSRTSSRASVRSTGSRRNASLRRVLPNTPRQIITKEPERMYKVVLAGDAAVGKSSFILRLCKDKFISNLNSTLGVDFQTKTIEQDGRVIALQLWDTAGQERFRSVAKSYFRRCDGVLLLYDSSYERSFLSIRRWCEAIEESANKKLPIMFVANKTDLRDELQNDGRKCIRVVETEEGQRLAREYDGLFIEASAKKGDNILEAVTELARLMRANEDLEVQNVGLHLQEIKTKENKLVNCCTL